MSQPRQGVMPANGNPPFYYASFSGLWVYYAVNVQLLNRALSVYAPQFQAFDFGGGLGLVNFNFMNYAGHSGQNDPNAYSDILKPVVATCAPPFPPSLGVEPSNECEFNIVCTPLARAAQIPTQMSVMDYIAGADHTKTIGNFRIGVPCDDRIAVYWGTCNFGENKIMTHPFLYNVPSPNNPGQNQWQFTVPGMVSEPFNFNAAQFTCQPNMFSMTVDVSNLTPVMCNSSEIIDYSLFSESGASRPAGSRRNLFGALQGYDLSKLPPNTMSLAIGASTHPLTAVLQSLLAGAKAVAVQTFQSQPVVAESSIYYVDV